MKQEIQLETNRAVSFVAKKSISEYDSLTHDCNAALLKGTGKGNDFLGWVNLPSEISETDFVELEVCAKKLRENCDVVVVIGIGGSYLGARAVIDALSSSFKLEQINDRAPEMIYAGQNIGEDYLHELQHYLKHRNFGIISISKSGTTTEPALAFRLLKTQCEEQFGKIEAKHRIVVVTDKAKGALRTLATQEGYKTFIIEDNVGGRYSVLTPVGLLPIAVAGFDIRKLVEGAVAMQKRTSLDEPFERNISAQYAAVRNALYIEGKKIEILVNFHPKLHYMCEWWKQLYGESEGKDNKGIFPASVDLTTDLHSMGQYIQEGERTIFETVISIKESRYELRVPKDDANLDGLNYLAGRRIDEVNKMAELGTILAHTDGGVPVIRIELPRLDEYCLGQLIYFFEKACGISGYLLGVNPFDQPGVEAYKRNMFALLEKPGYEKETEAIRKKIK